MAGSVMAKKKPDERSPKNKERKDPGFRTISFRVSNEYAAWLDRAAKHSRITIASYLDRASQEHAKSEGFDESPPERIH